MNDERLIAKGMSWAVPHMKIFRKLVYSSNYSAIELTFKLLTQKCKNATIILGIDSLGHLKENIKLSNQLKNVNIDPEMWWQGLPFFPEKLLNPSLWDISS